MVLVRNVFKLKFGKSRDAVAAMKEQLALMRRLNKDVQVRLLTDVTGDFYTLVLEMGLPDLASVDANMKQIMGDPQWEAGYQKFIPFVESGYREILNVVDVGTAAGV